MHARALIHVLLHSHSRAAVRLRAPIRAADYPSSFLYACWYRRFVDVRHFAAHDVGAVPREYDVPLDKFLLHYAMAGRPVVLHGETRNWPVSQWHPEALRVRFGHVMMSCSHDISIKKGVKMPLGVYLDYVDQQHDETPLYVFDAKFGENAPALLDMYCVPRLFPEDLLSCLGKNRPKCGGRGAVHTAHRCVRALALRTLGTR